MHDDEKTLLTGREKTEWYVYLTKFDRDVYPAMKSHGFSRDTALIVFELNRVQMLLVDVRDALNSEED